jgi:hypothetical protein
MLASDVIARARFTLQDPAGTRWPDAEMLAYVNDGQREVVRLKPHALPEVAVLALVDGPQQEVPGTALQLLDVFRNMGPSGTVGGPGVTLVARGVLDGLRRNWRSERARNVVVHYLHDGRDPKRFEVYPAAIGGSTTVEALVAKNPANAASVGATLDLSDEYLVALADYVLFRAYSKDADFAANLERAQLHLQAFAQALQVKVGNSLLVSPRAAQRDTRTGSSHTLAGG